MRNKINTMKILKQAKIILKKYPRQCLLFLVLLAIVFTAFHNERFYKTSIGKITKVKTEASGTATNYNSSVEGKKEIIYTQKLTVKILNGTFKGKTISISNEYGYSRIDSEKYRKGDKVFLDIIGEEKIKSASITGMKRDQYMVLLAAALIYLVILIGQRQGVLSLLSIVLNIGIFSYGLYRYDEGDNLLVICEIMIVVFTFFTLLLVNGVNKRSFAAIISTLATVAVVMSIFFIARAYGEEIDFAALDYVTGDQDLDTIFIASIAVAGLGAVMDVAVSIASSLNELIVKKPDISFRSLLKSGREIGYDIMGTMINVLFFTYVCGLIPLVILKLKNEVSLFTIIRLQIPFEICRFLIGGIGIVSAIPVSIAISSVFLKMRRKKA